MRKIWRAIIFLLSVSILFLFSSCESTDNDETLYYVSPRDYTAYKNGIFLNADGNGAVEFLDFDSMVTVPICPKPNCSHTDPDTCSALGISSEKFIYDDKLCWFDSEFVYGENGEITEVSTLYSADVDGTNRRKIAVLDGLFPSGIYVKNGKAYFGARDFGCKNGITTDYDKVYLYSYDFESQEFSEILSLKEGYNAEISIFGRYENSLAFRFSDGVENKAEPSTYHYMFYDFDSGEFTECDKVIHCAQKDWLITIEDDGTIVINRAYSGDEYRITDERFTQAEWGGYCIFDEMLMCTGDGYAYELKTGKIHTTQICTIRAYYKGKYIVSFMSNAELVAVKEKELLLD